MEPEDGELSSSSDEFSKIYTPLERPGLSATNIAENQNEQTMTEVQDDVNECSSSSGEESSDDCINKSSKSSRRKKQQKRTVMLRVQASEEEERKRAKFKKYNIWTEFAEEDALTENMRGCDVTQNRLNDRNVEKYDFFFTNDRKRRRDEDSDEELHVMPKRGRDFDYGSDNESGQRKSVKSRLGHRPILDLDDTTDKEPADVGREMANKLFEEKDELLIRVVEILGIDMSTEIYKETQEIEANGGMMINNGARRRTPGGVFLFLLKNHGDITNDDRKAIFDQDRDNERKKRKELESVLRDRKVEELKERLSKHENLPALRTRKDLLLNSTLNVEHSNLSNPPPSPVVGQENSPEYKTAAIINHVLPDSSPNKPSSSTALATPNNALKDNPSANDDLDFIDLNYGDMDFIL